MRRLVDSALAMAASPGEIQFVFYLDNDDEPSWVMANDLDVTWMVGPRIVLSQMWNECFKLAHHDIVMHCGDDIIFRTQHWDAEVTEAMDDWPDHIGLVYGRDGVHDEALSTHGFLHRAWVDAVGYFVPPYFSSDYNDLWLFQVAQAVGRLKFLPDVFTEHMHPAVGKGKWDVTHQERIARHGRDNVDALYASLGAERARDVQSLRDAIQRAGEAA
jgi:hypothetical protein